MDYEIIDGIVYTKLDDAAQINLDSEGKVSGISGGSVQATINGKENSPVVTFAASGDEIIPFTATTDGDALTVKGFITFEFIEGEFTYTSNTITGGDSSTLAVLSTTGVYPLRNETHADKGITYTLTDSALIVDAEHSESTFSIIAGDVTKTLNLEQYGTVINRFTERGFTLVEGSSSVLKLGNYSLKATANEDAGVNVSLDSNGLTFVPNKNDGTLNVVLSRGDTEIFAGELECPNGSINIGFDNTLTLAKDTSFNLKFGDYSVTMTATDEASCSYELTDKTISFTPNSDDGGIQIAVDKNGTQILNNTINIDGTITFDPQTQAVTFADGTQLNIAFDNYTITATANGAAGGNLYLSDAGITFTPQKDDGGLELSVTKDGVTRTASLDVTGSVTYKLDGSISLAKNTVVKNTFADGNKLTITANTDVSGTIFFDPTQGLIVSNSDPEALNIVLNNGEFDIANISSITGRIIYSSGIITAEDGTEIHQSKYEGYESKLSTTGGSSDIQYLPDRTIYTAGDGATTSLDYLDGTISTLQHGTLTEIYEADGRVILSEGSSFTNNDNEISIVLETAGTYTLNGMTINTTADNIVVQLPDYDSITVDGIIYTADEGDVELTFNEDGTTTLSSGTVKITAEGLEDYAYTYISASRRTYTFTATNDGSALTVKIPDVSIVGVYSADSDTITINDITYIMAKDSDVLMTPHDDGTVTVSEGIVNVSMRGLENAIKIDATNGTATVDASNKKITFTDDVIVTLQKEGYELKINADEGFTIRVENNSLKFDGAATGTVTSGERTTAIEFSGTLTYGTDGSISLAEGTVVKNTFEDGNALTITANTDSAGTIAFDPDKGLTVTPATSDALTLQLENNIGRTLYLDDITGTLTYNGGTITLSDGASFAGNYQGSVYSGAFTITSTGGEGKIVSTNDGGFEIVSDDGAEISMVTEGLIGLNVNEGTVKVAALMRYTVTAGSDVDAADYAAAYPFTFETAGTYKINGMTINTTSDAVEFTPKNYDTIIYNGISYTKNDENIEITFNDEDGITTVTGGKITVSDKESGGSIDVDTTDGAFIVNTSTGKFTFAAGVKLRYGGSTFTALEDTVFDYYFRDDGILYLTPESDDNNFNYEVSALSGNVNFGGRFSYKASTDTVALIMYDSEGQPLGTYAEFTLGNYTLKATPYEKTFIISESTAEDGTVNFTYPNSEYNSMEVTVARDGTTIFNNNVSVDGSFSFNPSTNLFVINDGTKIALEFNGCQLTATAVGEAASSMNFTADGLIITPMTGDGTLDIALTTDSGTLSANMEVLSGSFVLGENGTLNIVKDTELQITLSDNYSIKFKTTDDAGGNLYLSDAGITFTPNSEDGGLELSVTKNGTTRKVTLNMTGSLTYKLDGSISLAEGTVVKNTFEDGNALTITANTDSAGTIAFDPDKGLTVTPSTSDALSLQLENSIGRTLYLDDITGMLTYNGGTITLSDGASFAGNYQGSVYSGAFTITSTGGEGKIVSTNDGGFEIVSDDGAKISMVTEGLIGLNVNEGTVKVAALMRYTVTAGSDVDAADYAAAYPFTFETAGTYKINGMTINTTSDAVEFTPKNYDTIIVDGIVYTEVEEDASITFNEDGTVTLSDGAIKIAAEGLEDYAYTFIDARKKSYTFTATNDGEALTVKIPDINMVGVYSADNDAITIDGITYTIAKDENVGIKNNDDGSVTFTGGEVQVAVDGLQFAVDTTSGSFTGDGTTKEFTFTNGAIVTLQKESYELNLNVDEDFTISVEDDAIKFDGIATGEIINGTRKAELEFIGTVLSAQDGTITLENGTEIDLAWDDGTELKLASTGSEGSIKFTDAGIKITSADENLSMELTTSYGYSTTVTGLQGSLTYDAGKAILDKGTKLTGTGTLSGQAVEVSLEARGGDAYLDFSNANGFEYAAGSGKLKVTYALGDKESTFTINAGSLTVGSGNSIIAEGTDIVTDLQDFMPAIYFKTAEAGTYTINKQTIETSAAGLELTATDNQMVFETSDDAVKYDGMTFAGAGNVTLTPAAVTLGDGVIATGFSSKNVFVLTEKGTVTADDKIFELTEDVPTGISVKGATDGFIFSRTITKESEDRFDEPDYSNIGKIFTEKFIAEGDNSYRVTTDLLGLEDVIGMSDGVTVKGGGTLDGEKILSVYNLITDTEGTFTIDKRAYEISGDDEVSLRAHFGEDGNYTSGVDNLSGTISGDFSGDVGFQINNSSFMRVYGDEDVSIAADNRGFEIFGLDPAASLKVTEADTYKVNSTTIEAAAGDVIVGTLDDSARLYDEHYIVNYFTSHTVVTGTAENDTIYNSGTTVTIRGLEGDDSIVNEVDSPITTPSYGNLIEAGAGNDTIFNQHTYYPTILGGAGDDSIKIVRGHRTFIDGGDGDDTIIGRISDNPYHAANNWAFGGYATVDGGAGDDFIDPNYTNNSSINGGAGADTIKIIGESISVTGGDGADSFVYMGGNDIIISDYSEDDTITFSATKDTVDGSDVITTDVTTYTATTDGADVVFAFGKDSLTLTDAKEKYLNIIDSTGKSVPTLFSDYYDAGTVTLDGYDINKDAPITLPAVSNIVEAVKENKVRLVDNTVVINPLVSVKIDNLNSTSTLVKLADKNGRTQIVGWTEGDTLDESSLSEDLLLKGNYFGQTRKGSAIIGGNGNDTILAGYGDTVDGGGGFNQIYISDERAAGFDGATIKLTGDGRNTIENFQTGFDGDIMYFGVNDTVDFKFDGEQIKVYNNDNLRGIFSEVADNAPYVNFLASDDNSSVMKIAVAQEGATIEAEELADYYQGKNSGVDFTDYDGDLSINLGTNNISIVSGSVLFNSINQITLGGGSSTLIGSAKNETLTAGSGSASISGGAGHDKLIGSDGSTTFIFNAGDGRDVISNFNFENDRIDTGDNDISDAMSYKGKVWIQLNDGSDYIILEDAVGKNFRINDFIAKVDANIDFDGTADVYVASSGSSVNVASSVESAEIWLDNSQDTKFFGFNLRTLNASAVKGDTSLVGNEFNNTIIAGRGDSKLWGGFTSSNDLLIGGGGQNTFYYEVGNGKDTVRAANDGDIVDLTGITLDQIADTRITADYVDINFTDGGSLRVEGNSDVTYQLSDGKYSANRQTSDWDSK